MCPSFSLCACRILKIRSCLRNPLAPGRSRVRAILVSSVMFFSFNSAIVIFTYGNLMIRRGKSAQPWIETFGLNSCGGLGLNSGEGVLCSQTAAGCKLFSLCCLPHDFLGSLHLGKARKHLVHGVLDPGVGFVKAPGRLAGKLAQGVAISHRAQSAIDQFRAHSNLSSDVLELPLQMYRISPDPGYLLAWLCRGQMHLSRCRAQPYSCNI